MSGHILAAVDGSQHSYRVLEEAAKLAKLTGSKGYYNADKCPVCGTKTRKEGRKDNREDKPRVNIDFNEGG